MKAGSIFAVLDEAQIEEFEAFVLEIPGKFSNPILAKFSNYKRRVLPQVPEQAATKEAAPETEQNQEEKPKP